MKKFITSSVFLLFLFSFSPLFGQKLIHIKNSCSFDGTETEAEHYVDEPSNEANQIVERIMRAHVLPQNFIIKAANCKNALATTEGNNRYILYSTHFLENFKKEANSQWAAYSVLAHEIGHHLSNHNLGEADNEKRKIQELQADKYAGGVLFRLGATLEQAQAGIQSFSLESETTTHPNKNARLESVAQGWKQMQELQHSISDDIQGTESKVVGKSKSINLSFDMKGGTVENLSKIEVNCWADKIGSFHAEMRNIQVK